MYLVHSKIAAFDNGSMSDYCGERRHMDRAACLPPFLLLPSGRTTLVSFKFISFIHDDSSPTSFSRFIIPFN